MKLIHCADLHLDSRMESSLPKTKAKERRLEILRTFTRMVEYASVKNVDAILLCGDLFDAKTISVRARNCVLDAILRHPKIIFYYLPGNHDQISFINDLGEVPENLKIFGKEWTSYEQDGVVITGAEMSDESAEDFLANLVLNADQTNIVMLHGMIPEYGPVSLQTLRGRNIDYLALGHIHGFRQDKLDERGIWCYCGCLEGRGFDECGEKGCVQLEIQSGKIISGFLPFAQRTFHEVPVDITGLMTQEEIQRAIQSALQEIPGKDIVKILLTGEVSPEAEKDTRWIQKWLENDFYFMIIKDKTRLSIRPEDYAYDISLKGEFVRLVMDSDMTEDEKEQVLRLGIRALAGEE